MKRLSTSVVAILAGLALAACAGPDPQAGRVGSDLPPGPLQPLPSDSAPAAPGCKELAVGRGDTRSDADADFLDITFTNQTNAECTAHGYPTLSMRDGNGRNMGEHATLETNGAARYIVLEPGATATATVRYPKSAECKSGTARIEVLIPSATRRDYIPESHPYCPGWSVTALSRPFR